MKNKFKAISLLAIGLGGCLMGQNAEAVIIDAGTSTLASTTVSGGPALTVDYSVDSTLGIYTYSYIIHNPITDTTKPDQFSVSFDAIVGTSVIAITSGTGIVNTGSSVTWFFAGVPAGTASGVLSFTSLLDFTSGNAGANDSNPPAPWSTSVAGGTRLDVPNIPDGGMTVAFLGFALVGVEGLRRKLKK